MRLIDADALINSLVNACDNDQSKFFPVWIEKQIDAQPTMACDAIDLLKEQEAVEPVLDEQTGRIWLCGKCGTYVGFEDNDPNDPNEFDKFCRECGKPVLWEGR